MRVTNNGRQRLDVPVKGAVQDGNPPMDSIEPGETKVLDVDPENGAVKGLLFSGVLVAEEESRKRAAAKE